jgi:hypothetical protein
LKNEQVFVNLGCGREKEYGMVRKGSNWNLMLPSLPTLTSRGGCALVEMENCFFSS